MKEFVFKPGARTKKGRRDRKGRKSSRKDRESRGEPSRRDSKGSGRRGFPEKFERKNARKERTTVTCDSCGKKCEVPFRPTSNKPIYCDKCYQKEGPSSKNYDKEIADINKKLDKIMKVLKIK